MKTKQFFGLILLTGLFVSCDFPTAGEEEIVEEQQKFSALKAYKKSDHQMMAAYFRTWRDRATEPGNRTSMKELPDSLDIAIVFPAYTPPENAFWDSLTSSYIPHLRERGTKVIMTIGQGILVDDTYENTEEGYEKKAGEIYAMVMNYDLDGLDVDVEGDLSDTDLQKAIGVFRALSARLGPESGTGKLLVLDANSPVASGGEYGRRNIDLIVGVYEYIDYFFLQAYGRSVSGIATPLQTLQARIPGFDTRKFFVGFSFYEERGARWGDVSTPLEGSRAYDYATWQPETGEKGGIFSYAVDRDGVPQGEDEIFPTDYPVTRALISAMNPPSADTMP
ncbi:glycoside hydrolase family 18 [Sinomicrobium oceani]|uniref:glycoside hydrolase family 18 n=1 Tax=Sinomicrobium oceani TaxID=1150368 RepID=UPI00227CBFDB|nr:glycoside hydrolase family 18 [Sinomicrobium oceani]